MNQRQELRKNKLKWNRQVSEFISQLIDVKRGFNGRGIPELGISEFSLKESFPDKLASLLHQLSQDYNKIISDADSLISEQNAYAQNTSIKQASWIGSRLWTRAKWLAKVPTEERKLRVRFLQESLDLLKSLENTRKLFLTTKVANLPQAITFATLLGKQWANVWFFSAQNLNSLLSNKKNSPKLKSEIKAEEIEIQSIQKDLPVLGSILRKLKQENKLSKNIEGYFSNLFELLAIWNNLKESEIEIFKLKELSQDINKKYHQILDGLTALLGEGNLAIWLSKFEDKKALLNFDLFEKYARKGIIDWAKEKLIDINPNLLARQSLDIVNLMDQLDKMLEDQLDLMESPDYNSGSLEKFIIESKDLMIKMLTSVLSLAQSTQLMMRRLPSKGRRSDYILTEMDFRELRKTIDSVKSSQI